MSYKQLQAAVKEFKAQGLTTVKLNAKAEVLQAEYDRLTNNASDASTLPVASQQSEQHQVKEETPTKVIKVSNGCEDLAGGSFYQRPEFEGKVNAQAVSESKRQASQPKRYETAVKDKYVAKAPVNEVRQQQIKGSSKKVACNFSKTPKDNYFVNDTLRKFEATLGTTERRAIENVKQFANAVKQVAVGFSQRQAQRNGIAA